jgi:hypothetical protein
MGIRFRCPNGHKLNVKSFLAGKRGVCPDCGQTFRIPPEGTDDSSVVAMPLPSRRTGMAPAEEDNLAESDFEAAVAVAAAAVSEPVKGAAEGVVFLPPMPGRDLPSAQARGGQSPQVLRAPRLAHQSPVAEAPAAGIFFPAPAAAAAQPGPVTTTPQPVPAPAPPPPPAPTDPIADAPQAVWYVRPPSGGQYGPARGDVMRKWIAEGRVSSDSLVWREGWSDWREAGPLFGSLTTSAAGPAATQLVPGTRSPLAVPLPAVTPAAAPRATADRKPIAPKRGNDMAVAALVCLVLVCVILVTVLVIVLSQGSA